MTSKLGIHLIPAHGRPGDVELVRRLAPGAVKLLNPDAQKLADLYAAAPGALFVLRDHPRSEQHDDMARDPVGTGQRHAQEAWADWQRMALRGVALPPLAQCLFLGMNEPHVWDALAQTVQYSVAFLDALAQMGLRGGALNLAVGWPANSGPGTAPDWRPYEPVRLAIGRGDHMLVLHEYWDHEGLEKNRGWWAERYRWCEWPVKILIGECGLDEYVANGAVEAHRRGWQGWLEPAAYLAQLAAYDAMLQADGRIVAGLVFTTDYGSRDWQSFDTEPLHELWQDRETNHRETGNKETGAQRAGAPWAREQQDRSVDEASVVPVSRFLFPVSLSATTCAGVNVRVQPGLRAAVVRVLATDTAVGLTGETPVQMDGCQWYAITSPVVGWMARSAPNETVLLAMDAIRLRHPFDGGFPVTQAFGVEAAVYARFGLKGHNGVDFGTPVGTLIKAVDDGHVLEVLDDAAGFGLYVKLRHAWGESLYAHLAHHAVSEGQTVQVGDVLGRSGTTGNSTGPHLHLRMRLEPNRRDDGWRGYSDPQPYLRQ